MGTSGDIRKTVSDTIYRDVIGRFASGVTVITTTASDGDHGTTASAVSSLSMDPPMLLVCLNQTSDTGAAILESGVFGVSVLAEGQDAVAGRFARKGPDKFAGATVRRGAAGIPLIADALAQLECEVDETVTGGTHTVFLARVREAVGTDAAPLTYFRGRFGRLESELDEATYGALRQLVVERNLAVGELLDLEQLAVKLDADLPRVQYALAKVAADGLIARGPDGYVVSPLTADAAAALFAARATIQVGVVEQTVGTLDRAALDQMERLAAFFARTARSDESDLDAFLHASHTFHRHVIALADCPPLAESYERLGIPAFWTRTLVGRRWWEDWDVSHHVELARAYRDGDVDGARRAVLDHRDWVTDLAREVIGEAGGEV